MKRVLGVSLLLACALAVPAHAAAPSPEAQQLVLAGQRTAKILVNEEGWHLVSFASLRKAGFAIPKKRALLQLYTEGKQVPIRVTKTALEFYGVPIDTLTTNRATYWLIAGKQAGRRIATRGSGVAAAFAASVAATAVAKPRKNYIAPLLNGEENNIYGLAVLSTEDTKQTISLAHVNLSAPATVEVALQGFSALPHRARVSVNGSLAGTVTYSGQTRSVTRFPLPAGILKEGDNVVAFRSLAGELDFSLIDYVSLAYSRFLVADRDVLDFVLPPAQRARVDGFSGRAIRVVDATVPTAPVLLRVAVKPSANGFAATIGATSQARHLLALSTGLALTPAAVTGNRPSTLHASNQGADLVIITHRSFQSSLAPLVTARQREGLKVAVVDVEDTYDEFGFGAHGPQPIKDFLAWTRANWKPAPRYVLLVGDATLDPRNDLKKGEDDFVPTKFVDTVYLETASDDWLVDFDNNGVPELAVGRLPVRTAPEASGVVGKIVRYGTETASSARQMVLVSDKLIDYDFEAASRSLYGLIPSGWTVQEVNRAQGPNDAAVKARLLAALNQGPTVVNFFGHGSVGIWTSGAILESKDVPNLRNSHLSLYVMMTCLNGFFQDPEITSLGERLLSNPSGGAVAVWSSTGETVPTDQIAMDQKALGMLLAKPETTLGDAMVPAKAAVHDQDVRRTWVLFGDPTTRLH